MAKVKITGHASGSGVVTVTAPNTSTDRTITLPDSTDTLAVNSDVTNKLPLAGGTVTGDLKISTLIGGTEATNELGIGVTPGTIKQGTWSALRVGGQVVLQGITSENPSGEMELGYNVYRHTDGANRNIATGKGCKMYMSNGGVQFYVSNGSQNANTSYTLATSLNLTNDGRGLSQFTAKAWCSFNGTGTPAIIDSHNCSSITDVSVGKQRTAFTVNMTNTTYSVAGAANWRQTLCSNSKTVGYLETITGQFGGADGGADDTADAQFVIFGD